MNKKRESFRLHIGSSSMLLIFVVLCLVSFGTLTMVSANADYKLSNSVYTRTLNYSSAVNQAEEALCHLDGSLSSTYDSCADADEYFSKVGYGKVLTFEINETQNLEIHVEMLYPDRDCHTFYRITYYNVVNK